MRTPPLSSSDFWVRKINSLVAIIFEWSGQHGIKCLGERQLLFYKMHQQTCQCTLLPAIVISCIVIPLYVYGNPVEKLNHFELQKHKNYKNDLNVAKSTNTDDPFLNHGRTIEKIELCRRGETVLVPVQNGLAMLPCRTKTAKVLHSSIRLYEVIF